MRHELVRTFNRLANPFSVILSLVMLCMALGVVLCGFNTARVLLQGTPPAITASE
jgi:hypothetical protein